MNQPYSEATRDKIAQVLWDMATDGAQHRGRPTPQCYEDARAVLDALAAAGLLLPEGAETRTEYAVRVDKPHPKRSEKAGDLMTHLAPENALNAPRIWDGWTTLQRTVGPWVEVAAVRLAEEGK